MILYSVQKSLIAAVKAWIMLCLIFIFLIHIGHAQEEIIPDPNKRDMRVLTEYEEGKFTVESLIADLKDKNADIQMDASYKLRQIGDRRAVEPLIALLKDEDPAVRTQAAGVLGSIKDPRAVDPLLALLNEKEFDPSEWFVLQTITDALAEIKDPRAIEPLTAMLKNKAPHVRIVAVFALGHIGGQQASAALYQALNDEQDVSVKEHIETVIERVEEESLKIKGLKLDDCDGGLR